MRSTLAAACLALLVVSAHGAGHTMGNGTGHTMGNATEEMPPMDRPHGDGSNIPVHGGPPTDAPPGMMYATGGMMGAPDAYAMEDGGWGAGMGAPPTGGMMDVEDVKDVVKEVMEAIGDSSHAVRAVVGLSGYTLDTFDNKAQKAFVGGIATQLNVPDEQVVIVSITEGGSRRKLLQADSVNVEFYVLVEDEAAGAVLAENLLLAVESGDLVTTLQSAGLTEVTEMTMVEEPEVQTAEEVAMKLISTSPAPKAFATALAMAVALFF